LIQAAQINLFEFRYSKDDDGEEVQEGSGLEELEEKPRPPPVEHTTARKGSVNMPTSPADVEKQAQIVEAFKVRMFCLSLYPLYSFRSVCMDSIW